MPARGCPEGSAESVGLNCEAERVKFGAVHDVNSLSAVMIARDDHDSALSAAPKPRHHLQGLFKKIIEYQNDNEHRGMILNHRSQPHRSPGAENTATGRGLCAGGDGE